MKRKSLLTTIFLLTGIIMFAQNKMYIHKSDKITLGARVNSVDSIYFNNDQTVAYFRIGNTLAQYPVQEIDSITFTNNQDTVFIIYEANGVSIINPLAFEGVDVSADNDHVVVHSAGYEGEVYYCLSGISEEGSFKLYSDADCHMLLRGVELTNPEGPAINIQSEYISSVDIETGYTNIFTDGTIYSDPPSNEDQKGAFFSEGMLIFSGNGSMTINGTGNDKHALVNDDIMEINGGNITVTSADKDGIHAKYGLFITDGNISVTSSGDGIDGDEGSLEISGGTVIVNIPENDNKGLASDEEMIISGGSITVTVDGDQSKGIKSDSPITLSGGTITIYTNGDAVLEASGAGYDPSYCSGIKGNDNVYISGSNLYIECTGLANKGISADGNIEITSGTVQITSSSNGATYINEEGMQDAYVSSCLSADIDLSVTGGSVTTNSSGTGGKGISVDRFTFFGSETGSPVIDITTTGNSIYVSGGGNDANYAEAKAIKSDSTLVIENGSITVNSADDGIKSEWAIEINGGDIDITNSYEGIEAPYITLNNGNIKIEATDDGINTTFGVDGEEDDGSLLLITGAYTAVSASQGDGIDGNGDIEFSGGTTIVHGPSHEPEVGIDFNGTCESNSGFFVISGINSNMTQAPENSSDQYSLKITTFQPLSAGTLFHIQDASGNDILTFQPERNYSSIIFSSEDLQTGVSYSIYTGGSCSGTQTNGLYAGGTYSGGNFRTSFTINNTVTNVNF